MDMWSNQVMHQHVIIFFLNLYHFLRNVLNPVFHSNLQKGVFNNFVNNEYLWFLKKYSMENDNEGHS